MNVNFDINIAELINTRIICLHPKDTIENAKLVFEGINRNILPVVVDNQFKGVLFKQDFSAVNKANKFMIKFQNQSIDISPMRVEDFYKRDNIKILNLNARLTDAVEIFVSNRQYYIPILEGNRFVGLITPFDVFKYIQLKNQTK